VSMFDEYSEYVDTLQSYLDVYPDDRQARHTLAKYEHALMTGREVKMTFGDSNAILDANMLNESYLEEPSYRLKVSRDTRQGIFRDDPEVKSEGREKIDKFIERGLWTD